MMSKLFLCLAALAAVALAQPQEIPIGGNLAAATHVDAPHDESSPLDFVSRMVSEGLSELEHASHEEPSTVLVVSHSPILKGAPAAHGAMSAGNPFPDMFSRLEGMRHEFDNLPDMDDAFRNVQEDFFNRAPQIMQHMMHLAFSFLNNDDCFHAMDHHDEVEIEHSPRDLFVRSKWCVADAQKLCNITATDNVEKVAKCLTEHFDKLSPECVFGESDSAKDVPIGSPATAAQNHHEQEHQSSPMAIKIRSKTGECASDVEKFCKDITPGGGRIRQCLGDHLPSVSDSCRRQYFERNFGAACVDDLMFRCSEVIPGDGRLLKCMEENFSSLSESCKPLFVAQDYKACEQYLSQCPTASPGEPAEVYSCLVNMREELDEACRIIVDKRAPSPQQPQPVQAGVNEVKITTVASKGAETQSSSSSHARHFPTWAIAAVCAAAVGVLIAGVTLIFRRVRRAKSGEADSVNNRDLYTPFRA